MRAGAIQWFCDLTRTYGPIFGVWFAEDLTVFVSAPEHIRAVLTSPVHIDKAVDYEITEPWLGKGLLTNNGAAWHRQRKLLTPAFHFRILSSFREPMAECCRTLVRKLRPMANGSDVVDVYPLVSLMTLDIISGRLLWRNRFYFGCGLYAIFECVLIPFGFIVQKRRWGLKSTRSRRASRSS